METAVIAPTLMSVDQNPAQVSEPVAANYGANLSEDAAAFSQSLDRVSAAQNVQEPSAVTEALFAPLDFINNEAKGLAEYAQSAMVSGNELTPSEVVTLSVRSQEFMFYSQLTSNVANRTADGLQQLFRQQG